MSRRAVSLSAYLAYARGAPTDADFDLPDRPTGPLVWAIADTRDAAQALKSLCTRLQSHRPEISLRLSGSCCDAEHPCHLDLPGDSQAEARRFVAALAPDVVLWAGQTLRPALLDALDLNGARLIALDAQDRLWKTPAPRWLPDPAPATLMLFDVIYSNSPEASRRLRRLGVPSSHIRAKGPLIDSDSPAPCSDALHDEVASQLTSRPIWLAARLRAKEAGDVLRAHRQALRLAHRLLLIVAPACEDDADRIAHEADALGLQTCLWDQGDSPSETTQILLTETPDELGLWYRLAPLAFLGESLVPGYGGQDPYPAAALGAAILYGPNVGHHVDAYSRLVGAGAARIVRDADSLAAAVTHLAAPDQSAAMAFAGWDLVSSGAALVDEVISDICRFLDSEDL